MRGFTLVELLVAVLLSAMVLMGLAAIYTAVFRLQNQSFQKDVIHDGAIMSATAIARDLARTTSLSIPAWPCPNGNCAGSAPVGADMLRGCSNYDSSGLNPTDPRIDRGPAGPPIHTYQYCVIAGDLYMTWQDGMGAACPPTYTCDATAPNALILARHVSKDPAYPHYFIRPANVNNVVELHYMVGTGTAAVTVNTAVTLSMSRSAPYP